MAGRAILTLNAGSSSLKYALFAHDVRPAQIVRGTVERVGPDAGAAARALEAVLAKLEAHGGLAAVAAVGHRVVHGGATFEAPVRIDARVLAELHALAPIDPDHLPAEIAVVEAVRARAPELPQVACFDTAFHARMPRTSKLLPLPRRYEARGIRRYGFHGLSYTWLLEELARVAGERAARGRVILAHLGSGASLAAVRDGACVDTTMAFTPNSGVPMGTRTGDLDPGVIVHLLRTERLPASALDAMLSKESGLLGVSGTSADMRDLLSREAHDPAAADAVALFVHGVRKAVGALATTIGGVDTLVFSAGIGEHAPPVRARVCAGIAHLGVALDEARNGANAPIVSADASACTVRVIPTDEEAVIARETLRVLFPR
ncbi:MAG TPA: acetate/propionate family kinase [Polyangiaceae bacterium]